LPKKLSHNSHIRDSLKLFAANGAEIKTYGEQTMRVDVGLRRSFIWKFTVADVSHAILGADFLKHFGLLIDLTNRRLVDGITKLHTPGYLSKSTTPSLTLIDANCRYYHILKEYVDITKPSPCKIGVHHVQHYIITKGPPIAERARRLPPEKYKAAKAEFDIMLQEGLCQPSSSPWASPLHMVRKKNGEWRMCGDYRRLNAVTVPDKYPLRHIYDFSYSLQKCKVFNKLDLIRAFHQVPLAAEDKAKTAVITPFGLFEFNVMPFGLRNAAQTFQRLIDTALRGLNFCHPYIDGILIASTDHQTHEKHLRLILDRLRNFGLSINFSKCIFGVEEIDYLGYRINQHGIKPLPDRIAAIQDIPRPKTIQELRRFLGILNFYHRFLKGTARVQAPLNAYLVGAVKKDKRQISWTAEGEHAFNACKQQLADASLLFHPIEGALLSVTADASDLAIGATLEQLVNESWQPLGFFSKKLSATQQRYSTYDRELLAIYKSLKFFRYLIEGQQLLIKTDHKPLTYAFQQKCDKASPRQQRQLDYISQFSTEIIHISGKENTVADCLSRIAQINMPIVVSTEDLATHQKEDEELKSILNSNSSSLDLKELRCGNDDTTLYCDISGNDIRPYVPQCLRRQIFNVVHSVAHPSIRTTQKLLARRFVWPSMRKDIAQWVRICLACQRSKIHRHVRNTPERIAILDERFKHIHMDIIGPLQTSRNYKYCLTIIDRFTRWPEAIPIVDTTTDVIINAFYSTWIARFGTPSTITTDRGTQFESRLFQSLTQIIGSKKIHTTAYHPSSNGMIERWHRTLKTTIICQNNHEWVDVLPTVLLGLRTSIKDDINASAAELLYGTTLRLPGEFFIDVEPTNEPRLFLEQLRQTMRSVRPSPATHHRKNKSFYYQHLDSCTHVFVRVDSIKKPLETPYEGPFQIIRRITDRVYEIDYKGQATTISIERLKPAFFEATSDNQDPIHKTFENQPPPLRTYQGPKKVTFKD